MELLKYINNIIKLKSAKTINIFANTIAYEIRKETQPVFTMGSFEPVSLMNGYKFCDATIYTSDPNIKLFEDGKDLRVTITDEKGVPNHITFKHPYIAHKDFEFNRSSNRCEIRIALISEDIIVER